MPWKIAVLGRFAACAGLCMGSLGVAYADQTVPASGAAGANTHVVVAGETLSQIAVDLGVDQATLVQLNGLDPDDVLSIGQTLKVPSGASSTSSPSNGPLKPAPAASAAGPGTYTVADGDTLWDIAQRFNTTTSALMDANGLDDGDRLKLGAQLKLPSGASSAGSSGSAAPSARPSAPSSPSGAAPSNAAAPAAAEAKPTSVVAATATPKPAAASAPSSSGGRTLLVPYTVQPGETLSGIARQFDVRPEMIAQSSGLDDPNRLSAGVVVKVPLPGREHVVAAGETLRDIAAQEKVDLGSLIDFNSIDDPELIRVGQVVLVPPIGGPGQVAAAAPGRDGDTGATTASSAPPPPPARLIGTPAPASAASAAASAGQAPPPASTATPTAPPATPAPATPKPSASPTATPKPSGSPSPTPSSTAKPTPMPGGEGGIVAAAMKLVGSAYVWGGASPSGFDCSGYIWYLARLVGKPVSRGMQGQYNSGAHPSRDELKPGDLVFFQNTYHPGLSHNGVYLGNNQFVHAADEGAGVTVSSLTSAYWSSHWFGATRLS